VNPGRVVVLGARGFVGRHVADALVLAGHHVWNASRRAPTGPDLGVRIDVLDRPEAARAVLLDLRPTAVVNATGAVWDVTADDLRRVNVDLVDGLVDLLAGLPEPPRLVQLGSVHEVAPSPGAYGRSKAAGSGAVLGAARAGRLDAVVLRLSNAVGPGQPRASLLGAVAAQLREAARTGAPATLRVTRPPAARDFVDVRDVATAVATAATTRWSTAGPPPDLTLARGESVALADVVGELVLLSGAPAVVQRVDPPGDADVPVRSTWAAARTHLGWAPRRHREESLRDLWDQVRWAERRSSAPAAHRSTVATPAPPPKEPLA
jgi:dTDP-6-deoxy-L-talose 4-dehydrogenase [NAD(P)+]